MTAAASPPSFLISATTRSAANAFSSGTRAKSLTTTLAPFAANALAKSRPIPAPAPVTTTTLPSTIIPMILLLNRTAGLLTSAAAPLRLPLFCERFRSFYCVLLDLLENVHSAGTAQTNHVGQADPSALHLTLAGLTTQMCRYLVNVGNTGGSQRMPLRQETAGYVDRDAPAQGRLAAVYQPPALTVAANPEIFVMQDFSRGKAVMQFDQIQVLWTESRHLECRLRRLARDRIDVLHHLIALRPRIAGQRRSAHPYGPSHQPTLAHPLLRHEHRCGGAIDIHRAHQLRVRIGDHFRAQDVFERRFFLIHGFRIKRRVVVVLHRHLGELLYRRAVLARMFEAHHRKHRRHGLGADQSFGGQRLVADFLFHDHAGRHLFDADAQYRVEEPRLDGRPAFTERCGPRGAGIGAIHHGYAGLADQLQGALAGHGLADIAAVERLNIMDADAAVVQRQERRIRRQLRDRSIGIAPEADHVDTYHVHVGHVRSPSGIKKWAMWPTPSALAVSAPRNTILTGIPKRRHFGSGSTSSKLPLTAPPPSKSTMAEMKGTLMPG